MNRKALEAIALSVRSLTVDAVQKANSGHPGLPMGCAELGALIYAEILKHNPSDPKWVNRDRFVLSAGHGVVLQYALLYMSGYDLSLEDLKAFRQLGSKTPGHPEYGVTPGLETTTGPLGQGFGNAVGMAIAETALAERFNTEKQKIIDHYTYVLAGDGDLMEGVSAEAAALAGHLGLGKLIVFYDSNRVTIEGSTDITWSEDVLKRFEAYGWHVSSGDMYDFEGTMKLVEEARNEKNKPSIIMLKSIIAKGSPHLEGNPKSHGAPLGEEEVKAVKKALGIPEDADFYVSEDALSYFREKRSQWQREYENWKKLFEEWKRENGELYTQWKEYFAERINTDSIELPRFNAGEKVATRAASGKVLNAVAKAVPNLIGGSADLGPSNKTKLEGMGDFSRDDRKGRNLHFGVREHGMGAITNGIALHGGFRPFCATFLVFSDYMRPPIRLASMMKLPVIYVFTHDSVFVGEDGPTHQPVEHLAALRTIPGLVTLRPGDAQETGEAWLMALERTDGPTALALSRQGLLVYEKSDSDWKKNIRRGAYIVFEGGSESNGGSAGNSSGNSLSNSPDGRPDVVVIATGSEVSLAVSAAKKISGKKIRVVSMISPELFLQNDREYIDNILPPGIRRVVIEAGISLGWERFTEGEDDIISIDRFGESGPGSEVARHLGISEEALIEKLKKAD